MGAGSPEVGDGGTDGGVVLGGELVDVAGVGDLALGGRVDAVDLVGREVLEVGEAELLGDGVHARVLEKLLAREVDLGNRGVLLQRALAGNLLGEVIACVQELEEAAHGVDVFGGELDLAGLFGKGSISFLFGRVGDKVTETYSAIISKVGASLSEPGALDEERLMGSKDGLLVAGADDQGDDGARQVLEEGDTRRGRRVGGLLSEGELVLVGGRVAALSSGLSSGTTLSHLDVAGGWGGRVLDDILVVAFRHGGLTTTGDV